MSIPSFLLSSAAARETSPLGRTRSKKTSPRTHRRMGAIGDRRQRLTANPGEVTTANVETLLRCRGISASDVHLVTKRARALGIKPATMWMSIQTYGARELAIAVAGDLSHEALLADLVEGTAPDFAELAVFAGLNGLEAAAAQAPALDRLASARAAAIAGLG